MEPADVHDEHGVFGDRRFLLRVPDAAAQPRTRFYAGQQTRKYPPRDLADAWGQFAHEYPSLTDARGRPLSYHHFKLGLRWLEVAHSRWMLEMSDAVRIAQAVNDEPRRFWIDVNSVQAHWKLPEE
jgi:hypothetical protein